MVIPTIKYSCNVNSVFQSAKLSTLKKKFPKFMVVSSNRKIHVGSKEQKVVNVGKEQKVILGGLLAKMWRDIQGKSDWHDLLYPLHPLLASELMRYGAFTRSCYDAVDLDHESKHYGSCKYGKKTLFSAVNMEDSGYQVTKYIYVSSGIKLPKLVNQKKVKWLKGSSWIGYVAVCNDEDAVKRLGRRDIVVALRGTATCIEWLCNFMFMLTPARLNPWDSLDEVMVEKGFLDLYTCEDMDSRFSLGSAREQMLSEISRLVRQYKGEKLSITLTGHSMGSALAMLCAYDIAELGINTQFNGSRIPVSVFSFAGPRVGNVFFKERCEDLGIKILRVVNIHDLVTKLPGMLICDNLGFLKSLWERIPWSYCHVGVELRLDHKASEFCKANSPTIIHDLGFYLRLLSHCCLKGKCSKYSWPSIPVLNKVSKI